MSLRSVNSKHFKTRFNGWMKAIDGWMDGWREGGREGLGEPHPAWIHSSHLTERHSEGHGCLWTCLCQLLPGREKKSSEELDCMAFEDSRLNYYLPASSSTHSRLLFWASLSNTKTLCCLRLVSSLSAFPSEAGSLCQPATFQQISLYVCKRSIQVSQSCCCGCT